MFLNICVTKIYLYYDYLIKKTKLFLDEKIFISVN